MKMLFVHSLFVLALIWYPSSKIVAGTHAELLASHLLVDEVQIIRAVSEIDLAQATYQEYGPTIAVEVAQTDDRVFFYAEVNDEGGVLLALDIDKGLIETIGQGHNLDCREIHELLSDEEGLRSVCK